MDWKSILLQAPSDLVLAHELGLADDPSSIYGRERLEVRAGGALTLRWWQSGKSGALAASVDPAIVKRWAASLARAKFPAFPERELAPGASFRVFEAQAAGQQARAVLSRFHFEDEPPYDELCAIADSLCAQIRGRKCYSDPDPAKGAVKDVRPLPGV